MGVQQHWSLTASSNATADTTINAAERQAPSTLNDALRAMMAQYKKTVLDQNGTLLTAGTATALTLATNEVFTALTDGAMVRARFHVVPGAAATLAVDGLTAKPIQSIYGTALPANTLIAGAIYSLVYNATAGAWILHGAAGILNKAIGEVFDWPSTGSLPALCIEAQGQAISRTTYAALFNVYSTTHGAGDGSTTFNVPDYGGRVSVGKEAVATRVDNSVTGVDTTTVGDTGGADKIVLTAAQLAQHGHAAGTLAADAGGSHSHTLTADGYVYGSSAGGTSSFTLSCDGAGFTGGSGLSKTTSTVSAHTHAISGSTANAGNDGAHSNMPPTIVTRKVIFAGV